MLDGLFALLRDYSQYSYLFSSEYYDEFLMYSVVAFNMNAMRYIINDVRFIMINKFRFDSQVLATMNSYASMCVAEMLQHRS